MTSPEQPPPGYTHDDPDLAPSPVTRADLDGLLASVLFGPEDQEALRAAGGSSTRAPARTTSAGWPTSTRSRCGTPS